MSRLRLLVLLLAAGLACLAGGETAPVAPGSEPRQLLLAVNEEAEPPWVLPDGTGLDQRLVGAAARSAGLGVRFLAMPWPRCLALLETGEVDGVLNASYTAERAAFARYPRDAAGRPDPGRRLHRDTYSLFRRRGDALGWDPAAGFRGLDGLIGAQHGYHIVALLRERGLAVDDSVQGLLPNLEKLAAGRVQGAALHTRFVEAALRQHPGLAQGIEALPEPLATFDYFLVLARRTAADAPDPAEALWNALRDLRQGDEHQARCAAAGVPAE